MGKILKFISGSFKEAITFSSLRGLITLCLLLLTSGGFMYFNNIITDIVGYSIFGVLGLGLLFLFVMGVRNMIKE